MADEIIRELWKIKDTIAQEHEFDIDALVGALKKRDRPDGQGVVSLRGDAAGVRAEAGANAVS